MANMGPRPKPGLKMTFIPSYELTHLFGFVLKVHRNINRKTLLVACLITWWKVFPSSIAVPAPEFLTCTLTVPNFWYIRVMCDLKLKFRNID